MRFEAVRGIGMRIFHSVVALALALALPIAWPRVCQAVSFAYVTNSADDTVSVIDTSTNLVVATVPVGHSPFGVAVHPGGAVVYVTNNGGNSISVIDATRNTVTATLAAGVYMAGLGVNPAGTRLYAAGSQDGVGTLFVFDTASNHLVTSVPVGVGPLGVAVDSSGAYVYVTDTASGIPERRPCFFNPMLYCDTPMWIVDADKNRVALGFIVGDYVSGVAASPSSGSAYVANVSVIGGAAWGVVSVVDLSQQGIVRSIRIQDHPCDVAVNASGARIYVAGIGGLTVIDTSKNMMVDFIPLEGSCAGVSVTPDERRVYVPCCGDKVAVIDAARNVVTAMIRVGQQPRAFGQFIGPDVTPPVPTCVGDCEGRQSVDITDLLLLVNIALDVSQPSACPLGIPDDTPVTISLIMQAVNNALSGCPSG